MWDGPWHFTYLSDIGKQRVRVDIKERIAQYFTKDSLFKVRRHFEDGNVVEGIYTESTILYWTERKVEE